MRVVALALFPPKARTQISQKTRNARGRALILVAAFVSFLLSVSLYFFDDKTSGIFVGLWVPSILALGAFIAPRDADRP